VIDDLAPGEFSGTQGFLSPLAILNVDTGSVPFKDVARFIPQWIGANQEPSIGSVESTNASFRVDRGARSQTRSPLVAQSFTLVRRMPRRPAPPPRLFRGHPRVVEPHLIQEVTVSIGTSSPCCCGDCIDDGSKIPLACTPCLLRLLAILDISACAVPPD